MSVTQESTFPGIFQSVTNCSNTKHISPLPALSNLENDFALFQVHDAKWVRAFARVWVGKLRCGAPGLPAKPGPRRPAWAQGPSERFPSACKRASGELT